MMPVIDVVLNGRPYPVQCESGQELRLKALAEMVEERLRKIGASMTSVDEKRQLLMACLMLADEVVEARGKLDTVRQDLNHQYVASEEEMIKAVDFLASRVSDMTKRIAQA
jgi:cell division protein ZapA